MYKILVVLLTLNFPPIKTTSSLLRQKFLDEGDREKRLLAIDPKWLAFLKRKQQEKERQKDAGLIGAVINGNAFDAVGKTIGYRGCLNKLSRAIVDKSSDECQIYIDDVKSSDPELAKKYEKMQAVSEIEITRFENNFGNFKKRSETVTVDIIHAINQANDVNLKTGDIQETKPRRKRKTDPYSYGHPQKRDAVRDRIYLWMDRTVPYEIDAPLRRYEQYIRIAMDEIEANSCVRFVKRTSQPNWIKIVKEDGCWSSVGREFWSNGFQKLSLGTNCIDKGIMMHELLHALGFYHEQARSDRDKYIEIFWENIQRGQESNFERKDAEKVDFLGEMYDYSSIMHYGKYSFAIDESLPTIENYHNKTAKLGQRQNLSRTDIIQLNRLYDCKNKGKGWSNWSDFGPCDDRCTKERSRFCMNPDGYDKCSNPHSYDFFRYGIDLHEATCSHAECYAPIDGNWNKWGSWGACSVSCDQGLQKRVRVCSDPAPRNGGKLCAGNDTNFQPCQKRGCNEGIYDCTFDVADDPFCAWHLGRSGRSSFQSTKWKRHSGSTPSSGTGPDKDHTSGSGYYIYLEASRIKEGYTANLISPPIKKEYQCMKFSYSMYGLKTGTLKVKVLDLITEVTKTVFVKSGDQLKQWHDQDIHFDTANDFKVEIEAIRGASFQSDIAIDDIKIYKCPVAKSIQPTKNTEVPMKFERVDCYHDYGYIGGMRTFPIFKNFRKLINWDDMYASFSLIVDECSKFVKSRGYQYFGIAFFGECYTGPNDRINYARDGESRDCHTGYADDKTRDFLVGKEYSMMVYRFDQ